MKLTGRICPPWLCVWSFVLTCSILAAQQQPAPPRPVPCPVACAPPRQPPTEQPRVAAPVQPPEPEDIERMFSVGLSDWVTSGASTGLHAGSQAFLPPPHDVALPGKPYRAYGVMVTLPMKGSSRLEFSYDTLNANGNILAPTDLGLFGGNIAQGEPLHTTYGLRHLKLSYNFLTYPNPPQDAKLRIKTLWEFHYIQVKPTVTATVTAPDQPLADSQRIILPAVGLGLEYVMSKHFRLELRGSGMTFPHRSTIGDAEGNAVVRIRSIEIFAGAKVLYFKTSPKSDTFISGTIWGPDAGVRGCSNSATRTTLHRAARQDPDFFPRGDTDAFPEHLVSRIRDAFQQTRVDPDQRFKRRAASAVDHVHQGSDSW